VRNRPALFSLGVILFFVALGLADRGVGLHGQLVLGAITWAVLLAALRFVTAGYGKTEQSGAPAEPGTGGPEAGSPL